MKITHVEGIILRLPVRQAVADGTQDDLLIRIETDEGIIGYGEVDTSRKWGRRLWMPRCRTALVTACARS